MLFEWLERAHAVRDVHLVFLPVESPPTRSFLGRRS
jgi:hypothetical protein